MKPSVKMLIAASLVVMPLSCKTTSNTVELKEDPSFVESLSNESLQRVDPQAAKEHFGKAYMALKAAGLLAPDQELCFRQMALSRGLPPESSNPCGVEFIRAEFTNIATYNVHIDSLDAQILLEGFTTEGPNHFSMKSERDIYNELAAALSGGGTALSQQPLPRSASEDDHKASFAKVYNKLKSDGLLGRSEELCFEKLARARGINPGGPAAICGLDFIRLTFVNIDLYRVYKGSLQGPVVLDRFTTNGNPHLTMQSEQEIFDTLAGALGGSSGQLSTDPLERFTSEDVQKESFLKVYNKLKADGILARGDELCFKYLSTARGIGPRPAADCGEEFIRLEFVNINSYRVHLNSLEGPVVLESFTTNGPSHLMMRSEQEIFNTLAGALRR